MTREAWKEDLDTDIIYIIRRLAILMHQGSHPNNEYPIHIFTI